MHLCGAMSLWHTGGCVGVYLFVFLCIRPHLENASPRICLDGFSWYLDTTIIRCVCVGGGDNRGVQDFGVKGHLGVILGHCSNMLKTLLRLHNSIDFDETWVVKRSLAGGSFGVFRNFWSEVIWGHLGSLLKGKILNSLLQQNWLCQCVGLGQLLKSVHGNLFVRPVVKGSKVRKIQICFYEGSNVE